MMLQYFLGFENKLRILKSIFCSFHSMPTLNWQLFRSYSVSQHTPPFEPYTRWQNEKSANNIMLTIPLAPTQDVIATTKSITLKIQHFAHTWLFSLGHRIFLLSKLGCYKNFWCFIYTKRISRIIENKHHQKPMLS